MAACVGCGRESPRISETIGICIDCLCDDGERWHGHIQQVHAGVRKRFDLPATAPDSERGFGCNLCLHSCSMAESERSYCGLRERRGGHVLGGGPDEGAVDWCYDALPTNCVSDWVCPSGTGTGYPDYAYRDGAETGYTNLAVFYRACTFDCLFCQNWHFRVPNSERRKSAQALADAVDERTACICYFGGDPTPQLPHAIKASRRAIEQNEGRILRICWETNGGMNPQLLDRMVQLSLESGGCIKFDLKAWDETVHRALCGVGNERTLANFRRAAQRRDERPEVPLVTASTLLVPGYIDEREVRSIAGFIAEIDPDIPYALLAFAPQFMMTDLPTTSRHQARVCVDAAQDAGLKRVRIGNQHLLR